jgi:predicted nuclease with TOPRIM domain
VDDLGPQTLEERLEHARRELETAYEELQSTVEELEATNEELWSASEELETVSEELRERTEEALHANALLDSVLSGNARAAIVVDEELRWSKCSRAAVRSTAPTARCSCSQRERFGRPSAVHTSLWPYTRSPRTS